MPWYNDLRPKSDQKKIDYALVFPKMEPAEKKRTIENLLTLRKALSENISPKKTDKNLLVASWNIKEFGHTTQRLPESYFYIAEVLNSFDLIAIQEIKSTLKDLDIVKQLLGDDWAYMVNDITEGTAGNSERSAYLYNKKRVKLSGVAGEIILWDKLTQNATIKQLKRSPYLTGFNAGWKQFSLINLHLHPGDDTDDLAYRKEEVELILKAIEHKRAKNKLWNDNLIIVGDFNLYRGTSANHQKDNPTIALFHKDYKEVEKLSNVDTNASETDAYDRMFLTDNKYFTIQKDENDKEIGNVFNVFDYLFTEDDIDKNIEIYKQEMIDAYTGGKDMTTVANRKKYYKHPWRKNQLSDHYPIWIELITDSSDDFLTEKLAEF